MVSPVPRRRGGLPGEELLVPAGCLEPEGMLNPTPFGLGSLTLLGELGLYTLGLRVNSPFPFSSSVLGTWLSIFGTTGSFLMFAAPAESPCGLESSSSVGWVGWVGAGRAADRTAMVPARLGLCMSRSVGTLGQPRVWTTLSFVAVLFWATGGMSSTEERRNPI